MAQQIQIGPDGSKTLFNGGGGTVTINKPRPTDPNLLTAFLQGTASNANAASSPFASYAPSAANMFGSYADMMKGGAGTLGGMFNSYANAYSNYGNAIGNIAGNATNALANENAGRYGAWAQGNTGYQNMLGSLGTGALAAYGSAANAALQAQAMRESAAMKMMSDAAAANQAATATYGGQQAQSQAALGKAYADATAGLGAGRGAVAKAASDLGVAGVGGMANVAGNAMNYTRDMGKLDLARVLGTGQINALGQGVGGFPGSLTISGPGGTLGSGSYGGVYGSLAGIASPARMDPTPGWYSTPQYYDGGGKQGVLDAMARGSNVIDSQSAGVDSDASRAFAGLDTAGRGIGSSSILDALNSNYTNSRRDMMSMYEAGRKDPQELLREVFTGAQSLANPFLQAGKEAYAGYTGNFPQPIHFGPNGQFDPMPYLTALQAGWAPYQSGLDRAFTQQNANVLGVLTSGQNTYNNSLGNLNSQFGGVMNAVMSPNNSPLGQSPSAAGIGGGLGSSFGQGGMGGPTVAGQAVQPGYTRTGRLIKTWDPGIDAYRYLPEWGPPGGVSSGPWSPYKA